MGHAYMHTEARGQYYFLPYCLETGLSPNQKLTMLSRLMG